MRSFVIDDDRFHEKWSNFQQGLDAYVTALKMIYTVDNTYREPEVARRIGKMHMLMQEYQKAVDYLELGIAR